MFVGIEDPLHLAKHVEQRAGLPAHERRAAQSAGVFAADAPADGEHFLVEFLGQSPHPLHVVRAGQIEKRLNVELALAGVAEERGRHLVALQHVLHPHEEIGQHVRATRPCLRRSAPGGSAPSPDTTPAAPCRPGARTAPSRRPRRPAARRTPAASAATARSTRRCSRLAHFQRIVAVLLDQQHGLGLGGNQLVETRLGLAGKAQVAAVHQVAGRRAARQGCRARRGRPSPGCRTTAAPRRDAAAAARCPAWPR